MATQENENNKDKQRKRLMIQKALLSQERRDHWMETVINDPEFINLYQTGSIPLYHHDNHSFRPKAASLSVQSALKAGKLGQTTSDFKYDNQDYSDDLPYKTNKFRHRDALNEIHQPFLKFSPRSMRERVQDKIQNQPKCQTETLNTKLLSNPQWRQTSHKKWMSNRDFQSVVKPNQVQIVESADNGYIYKDPYMDPKVHFRSEAFKQSSTKNNYVQLFNTQEEAFKNIQKENHTKKTQIFETTMHADSIWNQRTTQSLSNRQRQHMNQALKIKPSENHQKQKQSHDFSRDQFNDSKMTKPKIIEIDQNNNIIKANITFEEEESACNPTSDKKVMHFFEKQHNFQLGNPLQKIPSETSSKMKQTQRSFKEKVIHLNRTPAESAAASYLNNTYNSSYQNTWQYKVVKKHHQNSRFQTKEELNESHILGELDKVKTYFGSVLGKIKVATDGFKSTKRSKFNSLNESKNFETDASTKKGFRSTLSSPFMKKRQNISSGGQGTIDRTAIKDVIENYFDRNVTSQLTTGKQALQTQSLPISILSCTKDINQSKLTRL